MNMKVKVWGKVVVMERADHPFVTVESLIRDTILSSKRVSSLKEMGQGNSTFVK